MVSKLKLARTGRSGGGAIREAGLGAWPTQLEKVDGGGAWGPTAFAGEAGNTEQVDLGLMD